MALKYIKHGTCNFVSFTHAVRYYGNKETVTAKVAENEIEIGKPELLEGDKLEINSEGRYMIARVDPRSVLHYENLTQAMEANPHGVLTGAIVKGMIRRGEIVIKSA